MFFYVEHDSDKKNLQLSPLDSVFIFLVAEFKLWTIQNNLIKIVLRLRNIFHNFIWFLSWSTQTEHGSILYKFVLYVLTSLSKASTVERWEEKSLFVLRTNEKLNPCCSLNYGCMTACQFDDFLTLLHLFDC